LNSELRMKTWVAEFTRQIEEIEQFYHDKFEEKIAQFIDMQAKYLTKMQKDSILNQDSD